MIIQLRKHYIKDYFYSFPMLRIKFLNVFEMDENFIMF